MDPQVYSSMLVVGKDKDCMSQEITLAGYANPTPHSAVKQTFQAIYNLSVELRQGVEGLHKDGAILTQCCSQLEKLQASTSERVEALDLACIRHQKERQEEMKKLNWGINKLAEKANSFEKDFEHHQHIEVNDLDPRQPGIELMPSIPRYKGDPAFTAGPTYHFEQSIPTEVPTNTQAQSVVCAVEEDKSPRFQHTLLASYAHASPPKDFICNSETINILGQKMCKDMEELRKDVEQQRKDNASLAQRCDELEKRLASTDEKVEVLIGALLANKKMNQDEIKQLIWRLNQEEAKIDHLQNKFENHKHLKINTASMWPKAYKIDATPDEYHPDFTAGPTYEFKDNEHCVIS